MLQAAMEEAPRIAVLTDNDQRFAVWRNELVEAGASVIDGAEVLNLPPFDVLLVDGAKRSDWGEELLSRQGSATVCVGGSAAADVSLPEDALPREVRLACVLLSQIVRLRRQQAESHRLHRRLSHLAQTDPLTGVANRRAWEEVLHEALAELATGGRVSVAIVDLDGFKQVNAHLGYAEGDATLITIAHRLASNIRAGDFLARLGGDEFGILFRGLMPEAVRSVADRVRNSVLHQVPEVGELTASVGVAEATYLMPPETLFALADKALRQAKQNGGNQVCHSPAQNERAGDK
jgi:diguanylate cyclase (GGDEF)-like protein